MLAAVRNAKSDWGRGVGTRVHDLPFQWSATVFGWPTVAYEPTAQPSVGDTALIP